MLLLYSATTTTTKTTSEFKIYNHIILTFFLNPATTSQTTSKLTLATVFYNFVDLFSNNNHN
jgi:hypothetical protein